MKYTTNMSEQAYGQLLTKALKGHLTQNDWSLMSPALRQKLLRAMKKFKKLVKDKDFIDQLPDDAIIKDINLEGENPEENGDKNGQE